MRAEWPFPERTCLIRSFPFPTGGRTRSRPALRLRYFRVGGSLPMRHRGFLPGTIVDRLQLDATLLRDSPRRGESLEAVHRGPHHVVRVRRAEALGQNVPDAGAFEHRADRTTRDHARSRRGRLEQDPPRTVLADDLVRDRPARERYRVHAAPRGFVGFAHRFADLVRLPGRDADLTFPIPHCNQRIEGKTATALHDLRDTIDRDDVLHHPVAFAPAAITAVTALAAAPSAAGAAGAAGAAAASAGAGVAALVSFFCS